MGGAVETESAAGLGGRALRGRGWTLGSPGQGPGTHQGRHTGAPEMRRHTPKPPAKVARPAPLPGQPGTFSLHAPLLPDRAPGQG